MSDNDNWTAALPETVQSLIADIHGSLDDELRETIEQCTSPIEQQFAAGIVNHLYGREDEVAVSVQETIRAGGHDYQIDFLLSMCDIIFENGNPVMDWETQLAVECDGWEWHSTKEQVKYDNKRDQDLLIYHSLPTIRFTGSQIFKDPIGTAGRALLTLRHLHENRHKENILLLNSYKRNHRDKYNEQADGQEQ